MSGFARRQLGRTGLQVSPLGIGGGWSIENKDVMYAFERGINYFFFSSDLHHFAYQKSAAALRKLCGMGSAVREQVVLATVSYVNDPEKISSILIDQFQELGIEYIDVFHWGWITDASDCVSLQQSVKQLQSGGSIAHEYRQNQMAMLKARAQEVNEDLIKRGLVRYAGASFHSRQAARVCIDSLDVLMLRYNFAHTGIEQEVFPFLSPVKEQNPGIVTFNSAHENGLFVQRYATGPYVPTVPDCYRFALTNPCVDMVLAGLCNRVEIDQALAAMEQGPLSEETYALLRQYGTKRQTGRVPAMRG